MHKIYHKNSITGAISEGWDDAEAVYIESVEVRGQQLGLFDHTDTEVIITYRPATEVKQVSWLAAPRKGAQSRIAQRDRDAEDYAITMAERLRPRRYRESPETDGTWGSDDETALKASYEEPMEPGGQFGDGMK